MTKRILLALLALTAALLIAAVVPLAVKANQHDQESYVSATQATAHSLAAVADENLSDNKVDPRFQAAMRPYKNQGDEIVVATPSLTVVTGNGTPVVGWRQAAAEAFSTPSPRTQVTKTPVVVAELIWPDNIHSNDPIGVVVLERPTTMLDDSTGSLWLYVALLAAIAMLAA